ncbi:MAG: LytR/AlgR family response regulator transcription factor [Saprospiraceae bacterium]
MNPLQTLIVDDEKPAVDLLAAYAAKIPELEIAGTAYNAIAARSILGEKKIDLLLLDIQMPDLSGLELLNLLKNPPAVILTTAYSEFALEGYELDVTDYLLKPIEFERFYRAVSKVLAKRTVPSAPSPTPAPAEDYFFVKTDHQIVKVGFQEILFIESLREYVRIHTSSQRVVARLSLQKLEELLPRRFFFRIHRTYIVNIDHLRKIEGNLVFIGTGRLPVSKGKREEFLQFIREKGLL